MYDNSNLISGLIKLQVLIAYLIMTPIIIARELAGRFSGDTEIANNFNLNNLIPYYMESEAALLELFLAVVIPIVGVVFFVSMVCLDDKYHEFKSNREKKKKYQKSKIDIQNP